MLRLSRSRCITRLFPSDSRNASSIGFLGCSPRERPLPSGVRPSQHSDKRKAPDSLRIKGFAIWWPGAGSKNQPRAAPELISKTIAILEVHLGVHQTRETIVWQWRERHSTRNSGSSRAARRHCWDAANCSGTRIPPLRWDAPLPQSHASRP